VGLSGGVDSATTAALLKKEGYEVTGVFMRQYDTEVNGAVASSVECTWLDDRRDAIVVAAALDIPFREWDFREEYQKSVVDYMVSEYKAGHTPNPDVMCNTFVKFGAFLQRALAEGADYIATGHYVRRVERIDRQSMKHYLLKQAVDKDKDQSYFLYGLTEAQLAHCLFPLGDYKKPTVRKMAARFGLLNWDKKDSQGICFVGKVPMRDFLLTKSKSKPGPLMSLEGEVVGQHEGAMLYTIGQRHGIGAGGGGEPYFVVDKDMKKNIVYVAAGEASPALFKKHLDCASLNWISGNPFTSQAVLECQARIRYRQPLQSCTVRIEKDGSYHVLFAESQRAVTPGQAIVFYRSGVMLGGGIIL